MAKIRGIRGATIADDNTQQAILEATVELLTVMVESNEVDVDDIAAAYFTTTQDLNAEFPAAAARQLGWQYVAPPLRPRNEGAECHAARHPRHAPRQHRQRSVGDRVPVSPWDRRTAQARGSKLDADSPTRGPGRIDMRDWDLQTLFDRGMLDDAIVRDELFDDIANGKRLTIYQGLDPTSPQHAHRPLGGPSCPALVPASRPSRHSPDWRLYRTHRRPVRPPGGPQTPHARAGSSKRRDVRRAVLKDLRSRWREPRADSVQLTVARQHHPRGVHRDHGQVHRPAASRTQHVSGSHEGARGPVPQRDDLPPSCRGTTPWRWRWTQSLAGPTNSSI